MATIKSYTDLEQSKILAEMLPIESADMYWFRDDTEIPKIFPKDMMKDSVSVTLACWSLAALLSVLPVIIGDILSENALRLRIDKSETDFDVWYDNLDSGMVEEGLDIIESNPVDACYEMIIRLHKLNLL